MKQNNNNNNSKSKKVQVSFKVITLLKKKKNKFKDVHEVQNKNEKLSFKHVLCMSYQGRFLQQKLCISHLHFTDKKFKSVFIRSKTVRSKQM